MQTNHNEVIASPSCRPPPPFNLELDQKMRALECKLKLEIQLPAETVKIK